MTPAARRSIAALRVVGCLLAALVLLVLAVPAVMGWVPLAVDDEASGVPSGSLVITAPTTADTPVSAGDVVTIVTGTDRLATRTVRAADDSRLTLSAAGGRTSDVDRAHLRAVERYRIPVLGHVVTAIPVSARPWWGRLLGVGFLAWAAAEVWSARRRRNGTAATIPTGREVATTSRAAAKASSGRGSRRAISATPATTEPASREVAVREEPGALTRADDRSLVPEPRRIPAERARVAQAYGSDESPSAELTSADRRLTRAPERQELTARASTTAVPATEARPTPESPDTSTQTSLPTRRARARARRTSPWERLTGAAASAVGTVVLAARTLDRRQQDPEEEARHGGRHRDILPPRTIDPGERSADEVAAHATPAADDLAEEVFGTRSSARTATSADQDTESATDSDAEAARRYVWGRRPSHAEVARAARVQEFEARRAAAEAAIQHEVDDVEFSSPAERLAAERQAPERRSDTTQP